MGDAILLARDQAGIEVLDIDRGNPLRLQGLGLRILAKGQPNGADLARGILDADRLQRDGAGQRVDAELRLDVELERIGLRRIDGHVELAGLRIKSPYPHGAILHIAHGESLGHIKIELRHAALRGTDRDPVVTIHHAGTWDVEIRQLRVELRFLRGGVAAFRGEIGSSAMPMAPSTSVAPLCVPLKPAVGVTLTASPEANTQPAWSSKMPTFWMAAGPVGSMMPREISCTGISNAACAVSNPSRSGAI